MSRNGRNPNGRFATGNPGGPGRPRRPVELEYLSTLNESVTLDDWREIVMRAVADAKGGDAKAREWLSERLMGSEPSSLLQLAADERAGLTSEAAINALAARSQFRGQLFAFQQLLAQSIHSPSIKSDQKGLPQPISVDE